MSPQGVMSSKQANNNPGLCPVKKNNYRGGTTKNSVLGACDTCGGENKMHTGFSLRKLQEKSTWKT